MTDVVDVVGSPAADRRLVLLTAPTFEPGFRGGGPIRSVARIIDTAPSDVDLTVVTRDRDLGARAPYPGLSGRWINRGRARIFYLNTRSIRQWVRLVRELRRHHYDLLYVNSMWEPVLSILPVLASRCRILRTGAVLVAPRGELADGALGVKSTKKRLVLPILRQLLRRADVIWHASTDMEAAQIRAHFPLLRVQVCMMEVSRQRPFIEIRPIAEDVLKLVYIGRISPTKNLHTTLIALAAVQRPIGFDIYGPIGDQRYWNKCLQLVSRLPRHVKVTYHGELKPEVVVATFAQYDVFAFPTLGENFGHVIAESLSAGCAVMCSDLTPWTPVLLAGGGTVVDAADPESIAAAVDRWAAMTIVERDTARPIVRSVYETWLTDHDSQNVLDIVFHSGDAHPLLRTVGTG